MQILHIAHTPVAGVPHRFVNLVNRYTVHNASLILEKDLVFGFVCGQRVKRGKLQQALQGADVLHFHGNVNFDRKKIWGVCIRQAMKGKKICVQYHGSPQRERPKKYQRNGVSLLVSTPEMLRLFKQATFFPNLIDETDESLYPPKIKYNKSPRFCHHYSVHTRLKNTNDFLVLKERFAKITAFNIIGKCNHLVCNQKRVEYDVCFDHLQGYYGLISLEAMAQGLVAINGANEHTMYALSSFLGGNPPFIRTTSKYIIPRILDLLDNPEQAEIIGKQSRKFVQQKWSGKLLIHKLIGYYKRL